MNFVIALILLFLTIRSEAAAVYSDSTGQPVSYCGWLLDDLDKRYILVQTVADGKRCRYPLTGVAAGAHTISATFVVVDPIYGRKESELSLPLNFTIPEPPLPPQNLIYK